MVQKAKINVKDRFSDGEIDLSMSDLDEVPVKEIAALRKTVSLDLSNNRLTSLPSTFTTLTFLTKLDLSNNQLKELPEDFGNLSKLKYLDLYRNNLERLPLSFSQLTALRFLDLKDNPLVPAVAKVAGPCVDNKGCQQCAREVVKFFRQLQAEVDNEVENRRNERQKQLESNQQKKQEEKKKNKKAKANNKVGNNKENPVVDKELKLEGDKKKTKSKEDKKGRKPSSSGGSLFVKFLLFVTLVSLVLWFLFALKYPPVYQPAIPIINQYYQAILSKFPPDYQKHIEHLADSVLYLQASTRNVSLNVIETIHNSDAYKRVVTKIAQFTSSK